MKQKHANRRPHNVFVFALLMLIASWVMVRYFNEQPAYIDAYYHYNGAVRLITGEGFTESYLWTYIGAPDSLPVPSHLYWMPGTSLVAAFGMLFVGATYTGAQIGLTLCLWGAVLVAYWLGRRMGTTRHAWLAGIIVLCGGFFLRFWGQTDTFAPYALFGSLALVFIGIAASTDTHRYRYWLLAGIFSAAGHLIRTDGLLLLLVAGMMVVWVYRKQWRLLVSSGLVLLVGYLLVMSPWFLRNMNAIGTPLPTGGTQAIWYTNYADLFNYPPDASPETFFADGLDTLIETRSMALVSGDGVIINFIALEGMIILTPFIFIALWKRRRDPFWYGVLLFAVGIHLAFALVFTFPGIRGGLFHAVAALLPFWAVLGLLGVDDTVAWLARVRKVWNPRIAQPVFSVAVVLMIIGLSLTVTLPQRIRHMIRDPQLYRDIIATFPSDTRLMMNDMPQLYYYTGLGGVVIPNESPEVALQIAEQYDIDFLIFERGGIPVPMRFDEPPAFLVPREDMQLNGGIVYEFVRD